MEDETEHKGLNYIPATNLCSATYAYLFLHSIV